MHLTELYRKHEQDKEAFKTLQLQVWTEMKTRHNNMISAFGREENLPEDTAKMIKAETDNFIKEWSTDTGVKYQDMVKQHEEQIQAITDKPEKEKIASDDREERRRQAIKEQMIIQAKNKMRRQKPRQ